MMTQETTQTRNNGAASKIERIRHAASGVRQRQQALYDQYAERFREIFEDGEERTREGAERAMAAAKEQLATAGTFTRTQGERFEKFLRRDLDRTAEEFWRLGKEASERLDPARVGAGALSAISNVLQSAGEGLHNLGERAEHALEYKTGEITTAGTLTCRKCTLLLRFKKTGTVPPCPNCSNTTFLKGY